MPTWPAALPQQFLINGYHEEPGDNIIRSPVATGPKKTRRRYTATIRPFGGRMLMTVAQYATFRTFYEDTIDDGSLEFDFPKTNEPSTLLTVFFAKKYEASQAGIFWAVSIELEEQP